MRTVRAAMTLLIGALLSTLSPADTDGFRNWTDQESGKVIEGKIREKAPDNSKVQLVLRTGKATWVDAKRLTEADRKAIATWAKPVDHLTARVVGSGKGYKDVKVTAIAGPKHRMQVILYNRHNRLPPRKVWIPAGETRELTYRAKNDYSVRAFIAGKMVDKETSLRKTGL